MLLVNTIVHFVEWMGICYLVTQLKESSELQTKVQPLFNY